MTTGKRIDVHAHFVGEPVASWLRTQAVGWLDTRSRLPTWSAEAAIAFMDQNDIATQLLSVAFNRPTDGEHLRGERMDRQINVAYAELIREHPARFGAFASIPAHDSEAALIEIAHALDELALDGILLTSNVAGAYLGDPRFDDILGELSRRRIPVFLHPVECPHGTALNLGRPSSLIEFPIDTARTITDAIFAGVFQRHRGLTLIVAHAGGVLPILGWRIAANANAARRPNDADIDPQHVRDVLRNLYYDTALAGGPHTLLPTLQITTPSHLLFGTDYPAAPPELISSNINNYNAFGAFTNEQRHAIDYQNAITLFPRLAEFQSVD